MILDYAHIAATITRLFKRDNITLHSKSLLRNKMDLKFTVTSDIYEDRVEA